MAENLDYMLLGYALGVGILLIMVGSLIWRVRSLQADETALQELEQEILRDQQ